MQAKAISSEQLRSISVDLETWTAAEKNNHSVAAASDTKIVYVNTDFHKNSSETKLKKNQAAIVMAQKILDQAAQFSQTQEEFKNIIIGQKLPSLNKFIETGKLGNLKNEWEKIVEENDPNSKTNKLLENCRKEFIHEVSEFLPKGLTLSEKSGEVSSMTHTLKNTSLPNLKNKIIKSCDEESSKTSIGNQVVDKRFCDDAHRTLIKYQTKKANNYSATKEKEGETISMNKESTEKNIERMENVFNGDKKIIETISKIINQSLIRRVSEELDKEIYGDTDSPRIAFSKCRDKDSASNQITVIKKENDDVILDVLQMEKYESMAIPPDHAKEWKINRGPLWSGAENQENFSLRVAFSVRLSKEDLKNGVINPYFDAPPSISYCIKME